MSIIKREFQKNEVLLESLKPSNICQNKKESPETKYAADKIQRVDANHTVFYIGAGTCGISAGADKTLKVLNRYIEKNSLDAEIVKVGCIGLCAKEPILDIKVPGKKRASFQQVTEDKVENITTANKQWPTIVNVTADEL